MNCVYKSLAPAKPCDMLSGMNEINTVREDGANVYITLTRDQTTVIDLEDFKTLRNFKWFAQSQNQRGGKERFVAARKEYGGTILMHRQIMQAPDGLDVDHINMDPLDNRRANLRVCTRSQNKANAGKHRDNTSGFTGVNWNTTAKAWAARLGLNGKKVFLGYFNTPEEAAKAYNAAKVKYFGDFSQATPVDLAKIEGLPPRTPHHNTTGVLGVTYKEKYKKFRARIGVNYKRIFLGDFDTLEEAAEAVRIAKQQYSKVVPTE